MNTPRIQQLESMRQNEPNDPFLIYALALEYANFDLVKAKANFEELLNNFPNYAPTYYHAANLFTELEEYAKAKETFKTGIKICEQINDSHALKELKAAYQNFLLEEDY